MFTTDLALQKTVSDIAKHRDNAIHQAEEMHRHMMLFQEECKHIHKYTHTTRSMMLDLDKVKKDVDRSAWRNAFSITGIDAYMDKKARDAFEKDLEVCPPEFTRANIQTILLSAMQDSEMMFKRGVVTIFKNLSGNYKCHDAFKVNKKLICSRWITACRIFKCLDINSYTEYEITDFDRALHILDNKRFNQPILIYELREMLKNGYEYENEYFKLRAYKNGNAHITMKRLDLLEKINDIIAEFYGEGKVGKR